MASKCAKCDGTEFEFVNETIVGPLAQPLRLAGAEHERETMLVRMVRCRGCLSVVSAWERTTLGR